MSDLMIDLETLSTRHDAAIISIGACLFDINNGEISQTFHRHIELDDSPIRGHISADTVKWWLKQSDEARSAITEPKKSVTQRSALFDLREFVPRNKDLKIWSNGATFDLVIIRCAMERSNHMIPWKYWQERDVRTIVDLAERIAGINAAKTVEFIGTKHDALADAIHQAKYVSKAFQMIRDRNS